MANTGIEHLGMQRPTGHQIRVLDILPGRWEDEVKCDVRVVSLDENPQYEGLSYVWGESAERKTIDVSGESITVTPNLHVALQRLRYPEKKRTMWIDQLCINQWDMDEKAPSGIDARYL